MKIKCLLLVFTTLLALGAFAQEGGVTGNVVSRVGRAPVKGAKVILLTPIPQEVYTAEDGTFGLQNIEPGTYRLIITAPDYIRTEVSVKVAQSTTKLNLITLSSAAVSADVDEDTFNEFESESNNTDAQSMPVVITSSTDVFDGLANYNFSSMRFRPRGYDTGLADVYMNGIYMNDAMTGYSPWSLWSGLNDATRNQQSTSAKIMSDFGVGGINGTTNIDARASQMRKGFRASVVNASATYRARVMFSYASPESRTGWTWAVSGSTRQGNSEWVDGVYYNAWSYFASVEKRFNSRHTLALTAFAAPTIRGVQSAAVQELYDLLGDNYYNPNWGRQDGKKRNARVRNNHEPVVMLNYIFTPTNCTTLTAALSYRFGKNGYSALDWYNVSDPRPDYYRNIPSYYGADWQNNPQKEAELREGWLTDENIRQVNWDKLYDINFNAPTETNLTNTGPANYRRAQYVIEERRTDQRDINAKIQLRHEFNDANLLNAGVNIRLNRTEYYKRMKDLLGGEYWLDVDKYAERDYGIGTDAAQNNLDDPNRLIGKGDKYGYDYFAYLQDYRVWASYKYTKSMFNYYLGGEVGYTNFYREGRFRKGLFPDDSKGKSSKQEFLPFTVKTGASYRIDGFNTVSANGAYMHRSPTFNRAFVSPRTRNTVVPGLKTEKILSGDLNYSLKTRWIQLRASVYWTSIKDQTKIISFYNEAISDAQGSTSAGFTNYSVYGINQKHRGFEIGAKVPIVRNLSLSSAFSYGIFKYTNNPDVEVTLDSQGGVLNTDVVRWKDYHVAGTPQTAASLQLDYRTDSYWFFTVNGNYFDRMYLDLNPLRRTDIAISGLNPAVASDMQAIRAMTDQEKFSDAFVFNASVGKSWYFQRKYNLGFNMSVNNIFNKQNIKTGGYEQMRLMQNSTTGTYRMMDSKYFYMFGTTYYLTVYFRF